MRRTLDTLTLCAVALAIGAALAYRGTRAAWSLAWTS